MPRPEMVVLRTIDGVRALEGEWTRLHQAHPESTVFQAHAWAMAWLETLGHRHEIRVGVAYEDAGRERITAILPMWVGDRGALLPFGSPRSDYNDLIGTTDDAALDAVLPALLEALAASVPSWSRMVFDELRETSLLLGSLRRLHAGDRLPFPSLEERSNACPVIELDPEGEVLASLVAKKSLRRDSDRLARTPGYEYRRITDPDEALALLPTLIDQYTARWAFEGKPSIFADPDVVEFYRELLRSEACAPLVHLSAVSIDGAPIACHLGFVDRGRFTYYKPTFDLNHHKESPGKALMLELLRECGAEGRTEFDLTRGVEPYKASLATQVRQSHRVTLFRTGRGKAQAQLRSWGSAAAADHEIVARTLQVGRKAEQVAKRVRTMLDGDVRASVTAAVRRRTTPPGNLVIVSRYDPDHEMVPQPAGTTVELVPMDLVALGVAAASCPDFLHQERLQKWFGRLGDHPLVLWIREEGTGDPLFFVWVMEATDVHPVPEVDSEVRLDGELAGVIVDGWTSPRARRRGIYAFAMQYIGEQYAAKGQVAWLYCEEAHVVSRHGVAKAGYVEDRIVVRPGTTATYRDLTER